MGNSLEQGENARLRKALGIAGRTLLVLQLCGLYFVCYWISYPSRSEHRLAISSMLPASPEPQPLPPGWTAEQPIADKRQAASLIIEALQDYHAANGSYPPYLFGGSPRRRDEELYNRTKGRQGFFPNPDPLLTGGYLESYPLIWPEPQSFYSGGMLYFDWREDRHLMCMYSTPGDHMIMGESTEDFVSPGDPPPEHRHRVVWDRPQLSSTSRQYALAGRDRSLLRDDQFSFSYWPGEYRDTAELFEKFPISAHPFADLNFFGYQRGEWLGGNEDEAWLWFYGSNKVGLNSTVVAEGEGFTIQWDNALSELQLAALRRDFHHPSAVYLNPMGLDLIDAQSGDATPDGIPDWICLVYILRDGKLVECRGSILN